MTFLIFIFVIGVLVAVHEFGHFIVAKLCKMHVFEFAIGFPPRLFSWTRGETKYSINLIPLGGFVKIPGEDGQIQELYPDRKVDPKRLFHSRPYWQQAAVLVAGVVMNILLGSLLLFIIALIGVRLPVQYVDSSATIDSEVLYVSQVQEDSPAFDAGIEVGLKINSVSRSEESFEVRTPSELIEFSQDGKTYLLEGVTESGETKTFEVSPEKNAEDGSYKIGVGLEHVAEVSYGIGGAAKYAWTQAGSVLKNTVIGYGTLIKKIFTGDSPMEGLSGPVGIASMVGDASQKGIVPLLWISMIISMNLAVLNMLPFPALDGGRLLFVIISAVTGKKISPKISQAIHAVGFLLLIGLLIFVTIKDIISL